MNDFHVMCKKANEIQELHKPKKGDLYICACKSCTNSKPFMIESYDIDCLYNRDLKNVEPNYAQCVKMSKYGGFTAYYNERDEDFLSYIWLPRQDQLQKIAFPKQFNYYPFKTLPLKILNHLYCFSEKRTLLENDYLNKFHSFEQLWLAFVMNSKFNKLWDGKNWVKE